ncbi:protein NRT1/ PTR FAMILY 5.6 [Capsicum galapagoense]
MFFKYSQAIEWYHKVVFPSKIPIFLSGLIIIHGIVQYSMLAIFVTHLTFYWELALPKAAQIVNIHEGLSSLLVIVVAQLSDSYFGRFDLIIFTHTAFILPGRDVTLKAFLADNYGALKRNKPSPILYIFNVVKAANLKRHLDYPVSPSQLFKNYSTSDTQILPHIPFLRWLDKAGIVEPSPPCPVSTEQAETAGRLFEVAKVRDVKRLISMFPLWSSFFVYSLVEATASTFFYVQAEFMDDHLGKISHVPIVVFVIIKTSTSSIVEIICELLKRKGSAPRRPPLYRVVLGMLCSFFCCLTAWRVEVYRRGELEVWLDDYNTEQYTNKISFILANTSILLGWPYGWTFVEWAPRFL